MVFDFSVSFLTKIDYSYYEVLAEYKIPISPREYAIVFDAIPSIFI